MMEIGERVERDINGLGLPPRTISTLEWLFRTSYVAVDEMSGASIMLSFSEVVGTTCQM